MPKVFISYRRADSSPYTGRLFDRLVEAFGEDEVFMDVDSISPGADFDELVRESVASCDVLLAVIGPQWLDVQGANGQRRLDIADDIVRHEIATALNRNVLVIPVLMGDAIMPAADDLPKAIRKLALRNAIEVRDTRFHDDVDHLIKVLSGKSLVERIISHRMGRTILGSAAAVLVSVGVFVVIDSLLQKPPAPPKPEVSALLVVPPEIPDFDLPFEAKVTNVSSEVEVPDMRLIAFASDKLSDQDVSTERDLGALEPGESTATEGTLDTFPLSGNELIFKAHIAGKEISFPTPEYEVLRRVSKGEQDRAAEKEKALREELADRERSYGDDHPRVATALNALAVLLADRGRYVEAEPLHARALKIRESTFGGDHPDVAESLSNLAAVYVNDGRFDQAVPLYNRLATIAATQLGDHHPEVARFLSELAGVFMAEGRYKAAEPLYKRTLEIRERTLGPEHVDVAATLYDLALLQVSEGKMAEAKALLERVLEIAENAFGPESTKLAGFLTDLAGVDLALGDDTAAEEHYKRAIAIQEKALGPNHPDLALLHENWAGILDSWGRSAEAGEIYRRLDEMRGVRELQPLDTDDEVDRLIETVRSLPRSDPESRFAIKILRVYARMGQKRAAKFLGAFES